MRLFFVSLSIVIVDQLSKLFVKGFSLNFLDISFKGINYGERIPLFKNVLYLTHIENPGIVFGIVPGENLRFFFLMLTIATTIAIFILFFLVKDKNYNLRLSIAILLGGAIGNLLDRVFYGVLFGYAPLLDGKVVDFIDLRVLSILFHRNIIHNYIFNFADLAVTVGVIMLLINFRKGGLIVKKKEIIENYQSEPDPASTDIKE